MIYMSLDHLLKVDEKQKRLLDYVKDAFTDHPNVHDFKLLVYINKETTDFLYDVQEQTRQIYYNEKWQFVLNTIWKLVINSDNLEDDLPDMLMYLFDEDTPISYEYFISQDHRESLLSPLLMNRHFDKNSKYIKQVLQCVLHGDWSSMHYGEYLEIAFNADQIIGFNGKHKDLLLELLEENFTRSAKRRLDMASVQSLERSKAMFDFEDAYSM